MRILFTAIGGSDPIKRQLDGPMLHCVRVYKPDIVYMYLSKTMLEYENLDGRYSWAVNRLADRLGIKIKIEKIEREDITKVHLFDGFYEDFEGIISDIIKKYPDAEIYLNASSGTPAIKSSLVIIAAMSRKPMKVIQVSSGERVPLHDRDRDETYDKELQWELNLDNGEDFKDRTVIVKNDNFLLKIEKNNIEQYLLKYDYAAALDTAIKIKDALSAETLELIKAAYYRFMLNPKQTDECLKRTSYDFIPQKTAGKRKLVEYILWLDILRKKGDFLSFVRGITPVSFELMLLAAEKILPLNTVFEKNRDGKYEIKRSKLSETDLGNKILCMLDREYGDFKDNFLGTDQLNIIINSLSENEKIKKCASNIRNAEKNVRNEAAHTIVFINDDDIKNKTGMSSEKIINIIKEFAIILDIAKKEMWSSYDDMNSHILDCLYGHEYQPE